MSVRTLILASTLVVLFLILLFLTVLRPVTQGAFVGSYLLLMGLIAAIFFWMMDR